MANQRNAQDRQVYKVVFREYKSVIAVTSKASSDQEQAIIMLHKIISEITAAVLFFSIGAFADIIVQPGYGQPHAIGERTGIRQQSRHNAHQLSLSSPEQLAAPYYLEVQPVYSEQNRASAFMVPYPQSHYAIPGGRVSPGYSPHAKMSGIASVSPTVFTGQFQDPWTVHNVGKRSADSGSTIGGEKAASDKINVAPNPTLNDNPALVNNTSTQDDDNPNKLNEKKSNIGEINSDDDITGTTLLGLDPTKMYSSDSQNFASTDDHQSQVRHIKPRIHQRPSQTPDQQSIVEQPNQSDPTYKINQLSSTTDNEHVPDPIDDEPDYKTSTWRLISPDGQVLSLSPVFPRNFPDPRPSTPIVTKTGHYQPSQPRSSEANILQTAKLSNAINEDAFQPDEIVGTSRRIKLHKHALKHHHPTFGIPASTAYIYDPTPSTSCAYSYPAMSNYVILKENRECYNDLSQVQTLPQASNQLYQISYDPQQHYESKYVVLPESTNCNTAYSYQASPLLQYYI